MLTDTEFFNILSRPESSVLDFKTEMYDFASDGNLIKPGAFVKDVISFANTVRSETSYIIVGVGEGCDGSKILHGLKSSFDDAIFQDKIKGKVIPRPIFAYFNLEYKGLIFGVFEFPVVKYPYPISATEKLKGVEVGCIYHRFGSSNTQALGLEVIRISDWLRSLPDNQADEDLADQVALNLRALTANTLNLSVIFTQIYAMARKYRLDRLIEFAASELQGIDLVEDDVNYQERYSYRIQKQFFTPYEIEIDPFFRGSSQDIQNFFKKSDKFYEYRLLFNHSISKVESLIKGFNDKPNHMLATITMSSEQFVSKSTKEYTVKVFIFYDDIMKLYNNIRQKAVDILIQLK